MKLSLLVKLLLICYCIGDFGISLVFVKLLLMVKLLLPVKLLLLVKLLLFRRVWYLFALYW